MDILESKLKHLYSKNEGNRQLRYCIYFPHFSLNKSGLEQIKELSVCNLPGYI